jgi:hypothetical protein
MDSVGTSIDVRWCLALLRARPAACTRCWCQLEVRSSLMARRNIWMSPALSLRPLIAAASTSKVVHTMWPPLPSSPSPVMLRSSSPLAAHVRKPHGTHCSHPEPRRLTVKADAPLRSTRWCSTPSSLCSTMPRMLPPSFELMNTGSQQS